MDSQQIEAHQKGLDEDERKIIARIQAIEAQK